MYSAWKLHGGVLQLGPNLGMPFTRGMGQGLFEMRVRGKEGLGRAFFCTVVEGKIVVLHAFIKKSQKVPQRERKVARKRLVEVKRRSPGGDRDEDP